MMSLFSKVGLLAVCSLVSASIVVQAQNPSSANKCNNPNNIVQNCGFDTSLAGFVLGGGGNKNYVYSYNANVQPTSGQDFGRSAILGSTNHQDDTLTQNLPLKPFKQYKISFDFGVYIQNNQNGDPTLHGQVTFDGHTLFNFQGSEETTVVPAGNTPYSTIGQFYHREYLWKIVDLNTADLAIVIAGQSVPSYFVIDNIVVVEVVKTSSSSSTGAASPMISSSTGAVVVPNPSSTASAPVASSTAGPIVIPTPSTAGPVAHSSTGPAGSQNTGLPGAVGDPQFTGFLGQSYQVHGSADNVYNVISSRHLQYNALFKYLDQGKCRVGTECFAHPGNYFGQVGVLIKSDSGEHENKAMSFHSSKFVDARAGGGSTKEGHDDDVTEVSGLGELMQAHGDHHDFQLTITAGSVSNGMTVQMGNVTLSPSNKRIQLTEQSGLFFPSKFEFYIETVDFTIKLENSDMFLNQGVSINDVLVKDIKTYQSDKSSSTVTVNDLPHGILGQTWQMKSYDNKWKFIQGTLNEYIVEDGITGTLFKYNRFE